VFDTDNTENEIEIVDAVTEEEIDGIQGAPAASRSIIENQSLADLITKHAVCRCCHGNLELTYPTVCIATMPTLKCLNPECFVDIKRDAVASSFSVFHHQ
jgi:hypothetical protein